MVTPIFDRMPCDGPISAPFGAIDSVHASGHSGVDIAVNAWTPIVAPCAASVRFISASSQPDWWWPTFGNSVILEHDGYVSLYAHMVQPPSVAVRQGVSAGDVLGYVGNTGYSFGPHLHWGLAPASNPWLNRGLGLLDPLLFMAEEPAPEPQPEHDAGHWIELANEAHVEEEADVQIKELDQGETVAALESVARSLGMALNDQQGMTVVEVTAGSPKPIPAGGRALLFITRD